jgi:phosphocarrier protein
MVNRRGLHARAAARFVQALEPLDVEATVSREGHAVDGHSIMGLLMLAAPCGGTVAVTLRGPDAGRAAEALEALVASGFGEDE